MREIQTNPIWVKVIADDDSLIPTYQTPGSTACDLKSTDEIGLHNYCFSQFFRQSSRR